MVNKDDDFIEVISEDKEGNEVKIFVKKPGTKEYRESQIEYNRAFRAALESGAVLKKRLNEYMREQGIWDDETETQEQKLLNLMTDSEAALKKGGIPLAEAKELALKLRATRAEFRSLVAERTVLDGNTVEGQADNARFNALCVECIYNKDKRTLSFSSIEEYDKQGDQPWAVKAAGELASALYQLDPNYDNTLTENKFLKAYNFANEENRLINADGHPIFIDKEDNNKEYLINEDGRFIAYRTDEGYKNQDPEDAYLVNKEGLEVDEDGDLVDGFSPFLDDSGNPVPVPEKAEDSTEEAEEEVAEEAENAPKKRGRPKKTEEVS